MKQVIPITTTLKNREDFFTMHNNSNQENRTDNEILSLLSAPLADNEIEWKVQTVINGNQGLQALVVPYVTSRAAMQRLDDVFGMNWSCSERVINLNGVCGIECTISVMDGKGNVITSRSDVAEPTNIEPLKGGSSDAFKRASVKFGIGRFLYSLPTQFVDILAHKPQGQQYERVNSRYKVGGQQQLVKGYYIRPSVSAILSKNQQNSPQPQQQKSQQPTRQTNNPQPQSAPQQTNVPRNQQNNPQNLQTMNNQPSTQSPEDMKKAQNLVWNVLNYFNLQGSVGHVFTQLGFPHVTAIEKASFNELLSVHGAISPTMLLFQRGFELGFSDIQIYPLCSEVLNAQISSFTDMFGKLTNLQMKQCTNRMAQLKAQTA